MRQANELVERVRLEIINSPETADFMAAVPLEAAHQRERWGSDHDTGKTAEDWVFLVGWLLGKASQALKAGDTDKAKHHTISSAAALANWHAAIAGVDNQMRPGIDPEERAVTPAFEDTPTLAARLISELDTDESESPVDYRPGDYKPRVEVAKYVIGRIRGETALTIEGE